MPKFTVYAKRIDIVRLKAIVQAVGINRAWQIAREQNEDFFQFISSVSPDGVEIMEVVEKEN